MMDICREEGVPEPIYESDGYTVKVTFWKSTIQKTIQKDAETIQKASQNNVSASQKSKIVSQKELSASQKTIIELVSNNSKITTTEIASHLGIDRRNVQVHIKKLQELALLRREGGRKNGRWVVMFDIDNENEE